MISLFDFFRRQWSGSPKLFSYNKKWNGVCGVLCAFFTRGRVNFFFRVSMIRGYNYNTAALEGARNNFSDCRIKYFNCSRCCLKVSRMSYHVGVCKIYQNEIVLLDIFEHRRHYLRGCHFRHLIKISGMRRVNQNAIFLEKRLFISAVEKICDMRVLFCLGNMKLCHACLGNHAPKRPMNIKRGERNLCRKSYLVCRLLLEKKIASFR